MPKVGWWSRLTGGKSPSGVRPAPVQSQPSHQMPGPVAKSVSVIGSYPFGLDHRVDMARDPMIDALRFNTATDVFGSEKDILQGLIEECGEKELWIDLKTRQLRIAEAAYLPYAILELTHEISVDTPFEVIFRKGVWKGIEAQGNRLMVASPKGFERNSGKGEAINILSPSLVVHGFFTPSDKRYVKAAKALGIHKFMLSFVEEESDITSMLKLDPKAEIVAKIESQKGIRFVKEIYPKYAERVRLMAAMDDLFTNMGEDKIQMLSALQTIIDADPSAIAASRILNSLQGGYEISFQDLTSLSFLRKIGFSSFMLDDSLCRDQDALFAALRIIEELQIEGLL
ncbi:MAG: hypothetical protein HQ564_03945 [Candidatus Saganbacteria bacterium]|nr:hypothetical protein [Candidatus Saganbacteria bacterium]